MNALRRNPRCIPGSECSLQANTRSKGRWIARSLWQLPALLLACLLFPRTSFAATPISFVIEPQQGAQRDSRPAHFNWLVESANGSPPRIGQYACGSYWVAPASGDTGVRLLSLTGSGKAGETDLLSLDADPKPHSHGLLSGSRNYGSYNAAENELPRLPQVYAPPAHAAISLVAAMQRNESETSPGGTAAIVGEVVDAYCIVTVVSEPPPENGANSIRPNFVGDTKRFLTWADFDLSKLPSHSFIGRRSSEDIELMRLRWNHSTEVFSMWTWNGTQYRKFSEGGRAFRAHILHDDYGSNWAGSYTGTLHAMLGANTLEEKKPLLASLIAQGMDMYEQRYGREGFPGAWSSGAGQSSGQANPIYFAIALTNDQERRDNLKRVVYENWNAVDELRGPQEMRQIMRGRAGVLLWGDGHIRRPVASENYGEEVKRYWAEFKARNGYDGAILPFKNGGQKTAADPHGYVDGPPGGPGNDYMSVTISSFRAFAAMCLLFPDFGELVNTTDPIEYADRITRHGVWASPDPVAIPTVEDQLNTDCNPWNNGTCSNYRSLWGPSASDWRYAIEGGAGRFASRHGRSLGSLGGGSVDANWSAIMALYKGPRYEDRFNPVTQCAAPDLYAYPEKASTYVFMRCGTPDAVIYYTTDGSAPTAASSPYAAPFPVEDPKRLKAIAIKPGLTPSAISGLEAVNSIHARPSPPTDLIVAQPGS